MESLSKVAVIGMGKIGTVVATNLVKGNHAVIVADRTAAKAEALAKASESSRHHGTSLLQ